MSEEQKQTATTEKVETEIVDSSVEDVNTNETTEEVDTDVADETELDEGKAVPYKRFKTVNDKMKSLQAELDALKGDTSQQTNEAETETTEANTETTNSTDDKFSRYEAVFNQMFTSKVEQVPEGYRELIPEGDDIAKMAWIDSAINKGLFTIDKPKDFGGLGANPAEQEQPNTSAYIKSLGRKF